MKTTFLVRMVLVQALASAALACSCSPPPARAELTQRAMSLEARLGLVPEAYPRPPIDGAGLPGVAEDDYRRAAAALDALGPQAAELTAAVRAEGPVSPAFVAFLDRAAPAVEAVALGARRRDGRGPMQLLATDTEESGIAWLRLSGLVALDARRRAEAGDAMGAAARLSEGLQMAQDLMRGAPVLARMLATAQARVLGVAARRVLGTLDRPAKVRLLGALHTLGSSRPGAGETIAYEGLWMEAVLASGIVPDYRPRIPILPLPEGERARLDGLSDDEKVAGWDALREWLDRAEAAADSGAVAAACAEAASDDDLTALVGAPMDVLGRYFDRPGFEAELDELAAAVAESLR